MSNAATSARIAKEALAKMGLMDGLACDRAAEVLAQVQEAGLETVRVLFADPHGVLRGKTIVAAALESVFQRGLAVPSTLMLKDTSHRTVTSVWEGGGPMQGAGDILLVPDATTFRVLPWSPHSAWLLCDPVAKDASALPLAPRALLREAVQQLGQAGYSMQVGLEVEFHVFQRVGDGLDHGDATMPPRAPQTRNLTQGWQFLTDNHYAQLEPMMDDLRRMAVGLGMAVRSTEVEMGPSQFEFTFDPSDPLTHADNMVMFRTAVQQVCAAKGLHATFMCRPVVPNAAASGWHLHQSLQDIATKKPVFVPDEGEALTPQASSWIAGLLAHATESCLLSTPTVNGYKRYQPHQLAPENIVWGRDNRGAMVRAILAAGDSASRIENRVAEPAANPYLFFASQIVSGLDGLTRGLEAPAASENPYAPGAQQLPRNLGSAITAFGGSALYRKTWGDQAVDQLVQLKTAEWERYLAALSSWEQDEYFSLY